MGTGATDDCPRRRRGYITLVHPPSPSQADTAHLVKIDFIVAIPQCFTLCLSYLIPKMSSYIILCHYNYAAAFNYYSFWSIAHKHIQIYVSIDSYETYGYGKSSGTG